MSRIYDALKQTESSFVRMIEGEQSGQPATLDSVGTPLPELSVFEQQLLPETDEDGMFSPETGRPDGPHYRIVEIQPGPTMPVLPFDGTDRRTGECYRILRTNILHHPARPKVIAVTSAGPGDGKTTNAINIAGALALKEDSRVLLVDGDLRRGSIASMLGLDASPGLAEVLTGQCRLAEAVVQTANLENLYILPAGQAFTNPTELLDSAAWRELAKDLRERFNFTIVDTTPIGIVADYHLIQIVCDGSIVVVRPDHTDRQAYLSAMQQIAKGKLLGALLNCTEDWFLWPSRDAYGYYGR